MADMSRTCRGPWRGPGLLVVPPSHGTPKMAMSTSAGSVTIGSRMNVAGPAKRGVLPESTGSKRPVLRGEARSCGRWSLAVIWLRLLSGFQWSPYTRPAGIAGPPGTSLRTSPRRDFSHAYGAAALHFSTFFAPQHLVY